MSNDTATLKATRTSKGPSDPSNAAKLQLKMVFRHRQAIDELMFAAVTCVPNVLFSTMLLSQNSTSPVECHHATVKRLHACFRSTINDGLHLLRPAPDPNLPTAQIPSLHNDTHIVKMLDSSDFEPASFTEAHWAANLNTSQLLEHLRSS